MDNDAIRQAKALLGDLTPLEGDCGLRCGAACCRTDEDGQGGVYLFPGEDGSVMDWGTVTDTDTAPMLMCDSACRRELRPLACRFFPLTPVRGADGRLRVRIDSRARGMCPLARCGASAFRPEFVRAVRRALRALDEADEQRTFLEVWMAQETSFREDLGML